jgi:hypothetical protein
MSVSRAMYVFLATGLLAAMAYGQEYPFSDDFSNAAQSSSKWGKWYPTDDSIATVYAGGVDTVTNRHKSPLYPAGIIYHGFTAKTSTFTASCVVKRSSDTIMAGMWLCLSAFPTLTGYIIQLLGNTTGNDCIGYVSIYKYGSANDSMIFEAEYHQQNPSDTLKVSKQGSIFNVFCNGVYLGSCTDNTFPSGDFGLFVPGNATAVFDDVLFTNQFTAGNFPVCVVDSFNNSRIDKIWILRDCSDFSEHDTVLDISAPAPSSQGVYCEVPMTIDTFYSRLIVSQRSGDSNSYYGFYLRGPSPTGSIPMAMFGISGLRACGAYLSTGGSVKFAPPGYIHGKPFVNGPNDTIFYQDTIVVRKTNGSNNYIMYVNGHNLDTLTTADITFPIIGAGIFAGGGQDVFADYFFVGPDSGSTAVINITRNTRFVKGLKFSPFTSRYLFNPLGRIVGRRDAYGRCTGNVLAPGFYVTDEKKSGIIINKQEK